MGHLGAKTSGDPGAQDTTGSYGEEHLVSTEERLWDISDCAAYLKTNERNVGEMVRKKQIPHFRLGKRKHIRFVPERVKDWAIKALESQRDL